MNASTCRVAAAPFAAGATALVLACSGCATQVPLSIGGPWATDFEQMYAESSDPFVRGVLADGVVSDQEYAEMWNRFDACLRAADVTVTPHDDGSFGTAFAESLGSDAANETVNRCADESGQYPIGALYSWVRRNPENKDENEIMTACLIRSGAVPGDYTVEDFARDSPTQSYPYLDKDAGPALFTECNDDPLGILQ